MNCLCHNEPAYWNADKRKRTGGFWVCAVKARERQRNIYAGDDARERKLAQMRDRYDGDPIFRITKRLSDDARKRGQTLARKREALHGKVSQ